MDVKPNETSEKLSDTGGPTPLIDVGPVPEPNQAADLPLSRYRDGDPTGGVDREQVSKAKPIVGTTPAEREADEFRDGRDMG